MWVDDKNEQDPYNRLVNPNPPTVATVGAGGGAGGAGQPTGTQSNPSTQTPTGPTAPTQNFATVQDYLGANKTQGEDLGQKFTGSLDTSATNEKNAISGAVNQTQNAINAGTTNYDSNLINTALSNPTKVANDPGQLNSFLAQWNASYSGPSSFESSPTYDTATAASTEAQQKQAQVGTAGGQQQLISDQFGVYGQGNKGLDQAILQNSSYYPKVQGEAQNFQNVQDYLTGQAGNLDTAATKAATDTAAAKTNTQNAFANSLTNFQNTLNANTASDLATATAQANKVKADLASGNLSTITPDLGGASGVAANYPTLQQYLTTLNQNYGVKPDLSNYYTYNPGTNVTNATTASAQDYAKAAALQKLTGTDYSSLLNPTNAAQAGTWNKTGTSNGVDIPNAVTYLKSQLGQQDKQLLANTSLSDATTKLNVPNVVDAKNFSNVAGNQQAANAIIAAAQRQGMGRGQNGVPNNLDNLYHQAAVALVGTAGGGALNTNSPATAGILAFVRQLGTYLYGSPQY